MIEVEKQFAPTEDIIKKITEEAEFIESVFLYDVYYDDEKYSLSKNDMWLRFRDGECELKIPIGNSNHKMEKAEKFNEIRGEDSIREIFAIPKNRNFIEDIGEFGYKPFCSCKTKRRTYRMNEMNIDIDFVDFGDYKYDVADVEILLKDEGDISAADTKIENFFNFYKLKKHATEDKVIRYIKEKRPDHYKLLVDSGVVKK